MRRSVTEHYRTAEALLGGVILDVAAAHKARWDTDREGRGRSTSLDCRAVAASSSDCRAALASPDGSARAVQGKLSDLSSALSSTNGSAPLLK